jgi:hypothetical protein
MAVVDKYGNAVRSGSGAAVGSLYDSNNGNNNTTNNDTALSLSIGDSI